MPDWGISCQPKVQYNLCFWINLLAFKFQELVHLLTTSLLCIIPILNQFLLIEFLYGAIYNLQITRMVDIGPLPSFEGRWTRYMSKHLPKDHNPFMKDVNYWRTSTKSLIENFQGSDSKISIQRVHKQTRAFSKDYIAFRRMIKSQDMSQEDRNRCLKEKRLLFKFV